VRRLARRLRQLLRIRRPMLPELPPAGPEGGPGHELARRLGRAHGPLPPEPPPGLPDGRAVAVPGVGELFVRDTGGKGPPVLLLHGWLFPADTNWYPVYRPLADAGYRVLALDHRGHGRGLRPEARFRLVDCAADAAALVRHLGCGPVLAVGYSMGGAVAALMARDHPDAVDGAVLCATALDWQDPKQRAYLVALAGFELGLSVLPRTLWRTSLRRSGVRDPRLRAWLVAELSRGSARDLAEAGREIGRYDARAWIKDLAAPAAVILTTRDRTVPPRKQRELAAAVGGATVEVDGDHFVVIERPDRFMAGLLEALAAVSARTARAA
jgi:3-oxoadipate enol-lactonase